MKTIRLSIFVATACLTASAPAWGDTYTNIGLAIRLSGPGQVEVSWDTATNAGYRLEYCSTLPSNVWMPLCSVTGDGNRCCTNDTLLASQPRYYRVALTPRATSWNKNFGGMGNDLANSVEPTSDGGYVVAGESTSVDREAYGNHGAEDAIVLKLDESGTLQWAKMLGGSANESLVSVKPTADGGYICAGFTDSNDGDVSGNHGNTDAWLVRLATNGVMQWQKCFGGTANDAFTGVWQTDDGGYIASGCTYSTNGNVSGNHGDSDAWVVKTDAAGSIQWQKCLGGTDYDYLRQVQQASDGGYVLAGMTCSTNGDISGNHGNGDGWVVKLSTNGVIHWQRVMGGTDTDQLVSVQQTRDGGYIAAGDTCSYDGDITRTNGIGGSDCWVVKLDAGGNTERQKFIGGNDDESFMSISQTSDGGYIAAGLTASTDGQVSGQHGMFDVHVCKLDATGELQWHRCLGGSDMDYGYAVRQARDGGYVVAGPADSNDGDIDPAQARGGFDIWVIKLLPNGQ